MIINADDPDAHTIIGSAIDLLRQYVNAGNGIEYDYAPVEQNNVLGFFEPFAANLLDARLTPTDIMALSGAQNDINAVLTNIPSNLSLHEVHPFLADGGILWPAISHLFSAFVSINGISNAKTTKILHKKRPRLIPIIDGRIWQLYGYDNVEVNANRLVEVMKRIRADVMHEPNFAELHNAQAMLPGLHGRTLLRMFDMSCWQFCINNNIG